jgi:hypothetical protein
MDLDAVDVRHGAGLSRYFYNRLMQAQRITIALSDPSGGFDTSPDRVRLGTLSEFSVDVASFLRGEDREIDVSTLEVAVVAGSLAIQTTPIALAPRLFGDLQRLLTSESLDQLDARRREVLERWQKTARKSGQQTYRISAPFLDRPVVVNAQTDYRADDADQWVRVERYVRGEIMDLGGIGKATAHVKLPDGSTLKVGTDRSTLQADKVNRLYKPAMLRIRAQYNVLTQELRDAQLIEFVDYAPSFSQDAFDRLTQRGAERWKDIGNASAWVDELRGGGH